MIDTAFRDWARSCLVELIEEYPEETKRVSKYAVSQMTREAFEEFKCAFGSKLGRLKTYKIPIPGLDPDFSSQSNNVQDGKLVLTM